MNRDSANGFWLVNSVKNTDSDWSDGKEKVPFKQCQKKKNKINQLMILNDCAFNLELGMDVSTVFGL